MPKESRRTGELLHPASNASARLISEAAALLEEFSRNARFQRVIECGYRIDALMSRTASSEAERVAAAIEALRVHLEFAESEEFDIVEELEQAVDALRRTL